jgi:hypothetical protein
MAGSTAFETMSRIHHHLAIIAVVCAATISGCGLQTGSFAPVSGVVTMDGQPLPGAHVSFQPQGKTENPGPGSVGIADSAGRFELKTPRNDIGAVPGPHTVRISAPEGHPPLPEAQSVRNFDVPEDGIDSVDFAMTSK